MRLMEELIKTDDPVFLSWLMARLDDAGIEAWVFDAHVGSLFEGALMAVRRRVMVAADDLPRARRILDERPSE